MNQPRFFEPGDDFDGPAGLRFGPGYEGLRIARVAHGGRGHYANLVHAMLLDGALEALESAQRGGHCIRGNQAALEDAGAEARYLAILVERLEPVGYHPGDFQPAGIGPDIDGGEGDGE